MKRIFIASRVLGAPMLPRLDLSSRIVLLDAIPQQSPLLGEQRHGKRSTDTSNLNLVSPRLATKTRSEVAIYPYLFPRIPTASAKKAFWKHLGKHINKEDERYACLYLETHYLRHRLCQSVKGPGTPDSQTQNDPSPLAASTKVLTLLLSHDINRS